MVFHCLRDGITKKRIVFRLSDMRFASFVRAIASSKNPGTCFENVCVLHMRLNMDNVRIVAFRDMSSEERARQLLPNRDVGIDIVAYPSSESPVAVQCKFRSDTSRALSWRHCATFDSICARTGPWSGKLLFTTAKSVSFYGLKLPDERFVTRGDFARAIQTSDASCDAQSLAISAARMRSKSSCANTRC